MTGKRIIKEFLLLTCLFPFALVGYLTVYDWANEIEKKNHANSVPETSQVEAGEIQDNKLDAIYDNKD